MTYSHFKKPDSYKNISTSTYKEVVPTISFLNKIKKFFKRK